MCIRVYLLRCFVQIGCILGCNKWSLRKLTKIIRKQLVKLFLQIKMRLTASGEEKAWHAQVQCMYSALTN